MQGTVEVSVFMVLGVHILAVSRGTLSPGRSVNEHSRSIGQVSAHIGCVLAQPIGFIHFGNRGEKPRLPFVPSKIDEPEEM